MNSLNYMKEINEINKSLPKNYTFQLENIIDYHNNKEELVQSMLDVMLVLINNLEVENR